MIRGIPPDKKSQEMASKGYADYPLLVETKTTIGESVVKETLGYVRWYPAHLPPGDIEQGNPLETDKLPDCCRRGSNPEVDHFECKACGAVWSGLRQGQMTFAEAILKSPDVTEMQVRHWLGERGVEVWRSQRVIRKRVEG